MYNHLSNMCIVCAYVQVNTSQRTRTVGSVHETLAGNPCAAGKNTIFAWPLRVFVSYKNNFKLQFEFAFV